MADQILANDNMTIKALFKDYSNLSTVKHNQLLRLRLAVSDFNFKHNHIPGINNHLEDQLSRFAAKMITLNKYQAAVVKPMELHDINNKFFVDSCKISFCSNKFE